jgi:hypothetical protein
MNIESIESYMMPSISFKNFICPNPEFSRFLLSKSFIE